MEIALDRAAAGAEMGADRPRFELREQRLGPGRHLEREVLALQGRTRLSGCAVADFGWPRADSSRRSVELAASLFSATMYQ